MSDKITMWIVTVIGALLVLAELGVLSVITDYNGWLVAIGILAIGIKGLLAK